jgi:hypothetical protein
MLQRTTKQKKILCNKDPKSIASQCDHREILPKKYEVTKENQKIKEMRRHKNHKPLVTNQRAK